jgi:serine/threonine-protein kinase
MTLALEAGTVVDGKYRLVRQLGEGGMGVVWVAEHAFLSKHVALKLLRPELSDQPEVLARFTQEAQTTSKLEHENIVRVTDFGRAADGRMYLVMELLAGHPLSEEMVEIRKLPVDRAVFITRQMLTGLEAAHKAGVVHRDLKPENVFLVARTDGSELVKLVDFGIAKLRKDASVKLTSTGMVLGTPMYMAPEQARGVPDIDQRVDVHAAGVILYEMLAGRPPYLGENYNLVLFEILTGKPPHLSTFAPEIEAALAAIVMKSFAPDRNVRYQNAAEFRDALEQYLFAPSHDHGPTLVDVPDRPQLMTLGGTPAIETATPRAAAFAPLPAAFGPPIAPAPVAPPRPAADPFAPPEAASEVPLDLMAPKPPPRAATPIPRTMAPAKEAHPLHELRHHKRAAMAPQIWARRIMMALAGVAVIFLVVIWWTREPESPQRAIVRKPRAVITLANLPEDSFVWLDGTRTFLNPIEMPLGSERHELRIDCEGYKQRILGFVPSADQTIDASLEKVGAAKAPHDEHRRR